MTRVQIRQGDVLLVQVTPRAIAGTLVPRERGRIILAHGEATGHAHAIVAEDDEAQLIETPQRRRYLHVVRREPVAFVHEEHTHHEVKPGLWRVRRQREYHPHELRTVAD